MDMKRKLLLFTLLTAVVILFTEIFVLNDYLPSVRPSKRYYEKLTQQYKRERQVNFASITRTRARNKPVTTKQHAKTISRPTAAPIKFNRFRTGSNPQNRNMVAMQLSNKLVDEVNSLKSRKNRKKTQIKLGGENNLRVAQLNSKSQKRGARMEKGKRVLIYTPLFHEIPWQGIRNSYEFTHYKGAPCPVTNCSLTYRRRSFSRSDVVIFHGQDMPDSYELEKLNRRRPKGQIWIYFVLENPSNARETYYFEDMFNWTMTYEKRADIFLPYGTYAALNSGEKSPYEVVNPAKKDRLVIWTVSNCGGMRDWYVQELRNHIRVDIFGACGGLVYQPYLQEDECEKFTPECENLMKRYKFQLAFENGNCVDYITEKYWGTPLELGIVPVVLGGANYSQLAIPGSYINVLDFDSVKALADYLLYLDKNDTAYMEYFSWRKRFKVHGYLKASVFNDHYPWTCDICAKAQNPVSKSYKSLSAFRDSTTLCGLHEGKLYQMIHVGGDAGFGNQYTYQGDTYDEDENPSEDAQDGDEEDGEEEEEEEDGEEKEGEEEEKEDVKVVEDKEEMKGKYQGEEKGQNRDTTNVKVGEIKQEHRDEKEETKTGNEKISEKNKRSDKSKEKETGTGNEKISEQKKGVDRNKENEIETRNETMSEQSKDGADRNKEKETETRNETISEQSKDGDRNKMKEPETRNEKTSEQNKGGDRNKEKEPETRNEKTSEQNKGGDRNKVKVSETRNEKISQQNKGGDRNKLKVSETRNEKISQQNKDGDRNKLKVSETRNEKTSQQNKGGDRNKLKVSETRNEKTSQQNKSGDRNKLKVSETRNKKISQQNKSGDRNKLKVSETRNEKISQQNKGGDRNKVKEPETRSEKISEQNKGGDRNKVKVSETRNEKISEQNKGGDRNKLKVSETRNEKISEQNKGGDRNKVKVSETRNEKISQQNKGSDRNKVKVSETRNEKISKHNKGGDRNKVKE